MTTSEPSLAVEIAAAAATRGVHSVDAPVSGGDVGNPASARLSIMIGGDARAGGSSCCAAGRAMGKTIVHQGGPEETRVSTPKMVNQTP